MFRTAIKEQGMLVDILKLLKSSDIEMMNNAATITFNVSVLITFINHNNIGCAEQLNTPL